MPVSTDLPALGDRRTRLRRAARRTVLGRRRLLAAGCGAVAVVCGVQAARPDAGATVPVRVAAHDLPSGTVLTPDDLVVRRYPADVAPVGTTVQAVGRTLAAPVREGEPVTDVRLLTPTLVAAYPDRVALPVRIADADAVDLLRPGDHIALVAADPRRGRATYVATDVPVLAVPEPSDHDGAASGLSGRLLVVAASPSDVDRIAGAAAIDLLSVVITR
jgi:Flp pilus assembly protein CpaB